MKPPWRAGLLAALALSASLVAGCNKKIKLPVVTNQRPEVTLTQAPVSATKPYFYSYEVRWSGFDPDGRIDHYLYAVDPTLTDTAWVSTSENRHTFQFASGDPDSLGTIANPGGYHTIVLKAIDNDGLASAVVSRSFFSYTVAPEVRLTQPMPNRVLHPLLPPTVTFRWTGYDPDGLRSQKPIKYKFHLFKDGTEGFSVTAISAFFDSLRLAYPPNFPTWDSTTTDTLVQIRNLTPSGTYVFAVTCFDEAGAYDPAWSFDKNLLYFFCDYPIVYGPLITMFNEFFSYTYPSPGYLNEPGRTVLLEVPVSRPINIRWSADAGKLASMKQYRWAMDIARLDDETPRSGPDDVRHWSFPSLAITSAIVGPFGGSDSTHFFYLEAEDNNGLKSLGILSLNVIKPVFKNELLFVDDTSFPGDQGFGADSILSGPGTWPSRAELDTFFYARGGVRWRYYPPGALSPYGIFNGYHFDTLGVRNMYSPSIPLSTLANYSHVVWYSDQAGAFGLPTPGLRFMTSSGHQNTLAIYAGMGGRVWLMGGGGAYNSLINYNSRTNDNPVAVVFSPALNELLPGRMMYDIAHWQSEIWSGYVETATRFPGLWGGWTGAPDYSTLPPALTPRTPTADPVWPFRRPTTFYYSQAEGEYLAKPNSIVEDVSTDPSVSLEQSTLDTLYTTTSGQPLMTLYHGRDNAPFVFSGFPLWYFSRPQAIQLADWVLQNLWHLTRDPVTRGPQALAGPAPPVPAAPARMAPRPARISASPPSARAPGR
ncbi:MAG TPA: hypothetical protein VI792_07325 [Candidatus Eisenbacteria bacterium]